MSRQDRDCTVHLNRLSTDNSINMEQFEPNSYHPVHSASTLVLADVTGRFPRPGPQNALINCGGRPEACFGCDFVPDFEHSEGEGWLGT